MYPNYVISIKFKSRTSPEWWNTTQKNIQYNPSTPNVNLSSIISSQYFRSYIISTSNKVFKHISCKHTQTVELKVITSKPSVIIYLRDNYKNPPKFWSKFHFPSILSWITLYILDQTKNSNKMHCWGCKLLLNI